jgi:uncharacterized membrane protein
LLIVVCLRAISRMIPTTFGWLYTHTFLRITNLRRAPGNCYTTAPTASSPSNYWPIFDQDEPPMNAELIIMIFDGEDAANATYAALRQLERDGGIAILDTATFVKHSNGTSEINDSQDMNTRPGSYFGVISGALIGLIGGQAGALIGSVAGAATGAAAASLIDLGFPKADLQAFDDQIAPGSSALIVLVEATWLDKLDAALASFDGQSTRRSLHGGRAGRIAARDAPRSLAAFKAHRKLRSG